MKPMKLQENADLRAHSTMRLGGRARWLAEATNENEIEKLVRWAKERNLTCLMIGQGSNIVWRDEGFDCLVIVNRIMGREILAQDAENVTVRIGGGEDWDDVVAWAVEKGWGGIEFLSRIPGTTGAAPVQNIGAYGTELAETLVEVEAYDTQTDSFGGILKEACDFSYRNSRFKSKDKGRFMITGIVLKLNKKQPVPPFYESLQTYFQEHKITVYTREAVREAVTTIRAVKLPDPSVVNNNGSFFTNPIVEKIEFEKLQEEYPDIRGWAMPEDRVKLAAGWLVEKAGFKGVHDRETGMATWPAQALVLVNESARSTADLLKFKQKIVNRVQEMFGVILQPEPELLP